MTAALRPTRGLSVAINAAYTDAYLTEDTDPLVGGLDGDPLPYVPKWGLSATADYEWTLFGSATAFVGGTLSFVGERVPDFGIRDDAGELRKVPGYETVDLRAGVEMGRWSVEAYVRNLANVRGITSMFGFGPGNFPNDAAGVAVIRPRTIGLSVGARF